MIITTDMRITGDIISESELNGSVNLSSRIALFGEARYQSIPIDGRGEIKWGGVFTGGIKFYF